MFTWLKNLFLSWDDPLGWEDPYQWIRIPDLSIAVDIYTGELSFGDGSSTSLGQDMSTLSPLGPPDENPNGPLVYQALGISISIDHWGKDEDPFLVGDFDIDFQQPTVVPCLINGRPANLSSSTTFDEVIELLNDLPHDIEPWLDEEASTLYYQWNNSFHSRWHFEAGKLEYLSLVFVG